MYSRFNNSLRLFVLVLIMSSVLGVPQFTQAVDLPHYPSTVWSVGGASRAEQGITTDGAYFYTSRGNHGSAGWRVYKWHRSNTEEYISGECIAAHPDGLDHVGALTVSPWWLSVATENDNDWVALAFYDRSLPSPYDAPPGTGWMDHYYNVPYKGSVKLTAPYLGVNNFSAVDWHPYDGKGSKAGNDRGFLFVTEYATSGTSSILSYLQQRLKSLELQS